MIYNVFSGLFFSFTEDRAYVKGPAFLAVYVSPCYFVICSAIILIYNFQRFRSWQRLSISLFVVFQISGTILQMFVFPDTLLALFMSVLGLMMMLFTMETPDYQNLVITIEELSATKKVAEKAKEEAERSKEIAQQANRAKSDFLANMSHEIRTPINAVLGMDEMILRESNDSKILEYASDIKQAGSMLLSLINDILDFSKIESGKMDIIPVDYDLGIVLSDTIDMIRSRAEEKKLQLELKIESNTPVHLHGDEVRLRQIITNILTNAVKYTPEGKVILTVSGKKVSAGTVQLYVSVKDTGIGIKAEDIGRLFDSFQRVDESRNRNIEGTGLGLSITMRLLNLMGSRLEVASTYGEGSDFYFYLEQKQLDDEVIGEDIQRYYENEKGKLSIASEQFYAPDARMIPVESGDHVKGAQSENGLVDWKKGRVLCMEDEEFYREMLQIFLDSHSDMQLRRYYEESDFENYRIKVHAMKSNLVNIGAVSVSEMEKQLELALKNDQNVSYVQENHDKFLAVYENVVSEVKTYLESANAL